MNVVNVTGPETVSTKKTALAFGELFGVEPVFDGEEGETALLSDASKAVSLFGYPTVGIHELIKWQVEWIKSGGARSVSRHILRKQRVGFKIEEGGFDGQTQTSA